MNTDLKLRFDQMRQGDPTRLDNTSGGTSDSTVSHLTGYARNLCLVWPDGRRYFLNYAYLIGGEFLVGEEMNQITLNFSSHTAILKGYGLQSLYMELLDHLPKILSAIDPRYVSTKKTNQSVIIEITVSKLE